MNTMECLREQEVMEAVRCGRWPHRCSEDLRAHVASCAICVDVLEVAVALHADHDTAYLEARVPPAGFVWWRAELRARQEALRTASRPMTLVQALGGACTAGVAFAFLSRFWPWLKTFFALPDLHALSFSQWGVLLSFVVALLIVAPLAMYLVLSDE